uniref:Uncharacterized protein n=1 Tax=Aegilops tauschii subsp. strangulata TaxID=200361 RepID=A0A453JJX0_AEGTS
RKTPNLTCLDRAMATAGEKDPLAGVPEEEEAAVAMTVPARQKEESTTPLPPAKNKKGSSSSAGSQEVEVEVEVPMASRRGGEKGFPKAAPPRRGGEKGSSRRGKEKRFPKAGSEEEEKKMPAEMVNDILSWEKPPRFTMFKSAGFFNKLRDELFEYQQQIKEDVEEKGYAELPADYEEYTKEYRKAYLKVFGTEPLPELCLA